uniref:KIB1-4 beta-propeller domain-containing protein n=1 Tax=Aegilops tauschii TaxID=37682 RepID=R7WDL3_AEGTA
MGRKLPALAPAGAVAAAGRKRKGATLTTLAACKRPARAQRTTLVRVLHPFTRVVVDFPPLAPVYHAVVRRMKLLDMSAAICSSASSATSIAVVVWFLCTSVVLGADPGSDWEVLHRGLYVWNTLSFQGKLYATTLSSHEILQLYPPPRQESLENSVVVAHAPYFADRLHSDFLLVESGGRMLLVIRHPAPGTKEMDWSGLAVFRLYEVHLSSQRCKIIPVNTLVDRSLFLSGDRCLSVSARDLPTLSSNSIYFNLPFDPIVLHSLGTGLSERLAESCKIHDGKDRIRPSVRPFTMADHLMTYCHTPEWSKGLMFHEYQHIPESFKELIKNIRAQDVQVLAAYGEEEKGHEPEDILFTRIVENLVNENENPSSVMLIAGCILSPNIYEHVFDVEVELGMLGLCVNYTMSNASSVIVWKELSYILKGCYTPSFSLY